MILQINAMSLAFNKKQSDLRKDWLYQYNEKEILDSKETNIPVETFIHRELIHAPIVIQNDLLDLYMMD